jgi:hypothetical protein
MQLLRLRGRVIQIRGPVWQVEREGNSGVLWLGNERRNVVRAHFAVQRPGRVDRSLVPHSQVIEQKSQLGELETAARKQIELRESTWMMIDAYARELQAGTNESPRVLVHVPRGSPIGRRRPRKTFRIHTSLNARLLDRG